MNDKERKLQEKQTEVANFCQDHGFKMLGPYVKAIKKMPLLCPVGHRIDISWSVFRITPNCKFCSRASSGKKSRKTQEELVNGYAQAGLTLLNPELYVRASIKMDVSCNQCGSQFKISWNKISQGCACVKCARKRTSEKQKMDINYIRTFMSGYGDTLVSNTYATAKEKLDIMCKNGHTYQRTWDTYRRRSSGCPKCRILVNEEECREIVEDLFWESFPKAKPEWLINPETGKRMELDGYNERLKVAFEYDGEQHFRAIKSWGDKESFEKLKKRDELKDKICQENGVILMRIPYFSKDKVKTISTIIGQKFPYETSNTPMGILSKLIAEKNRKEEEELYAKHPKQ
jgi:hypothetical protein